jgi:hypothetical protein
LLSLAFDFIPLRKNLFGETLGKIPLDFVYFLVKRKFFGGGLGGKTEALPAFTTKFETWRITESALWAYYFQFVSTFDTKLHSFWILKLAIRALHDIALYNNQ